MAELGITETSDFCGLAAQQEDLGEFFEILALGSMPAEEAIVRKISIRRA